MLPGTSSLTSLGRKHRISRNVTVTSLWYGSYDKSIGNIDQNIEPATLGLFPEDQRNRHINKAI